MEVIIVTTIWVLFTISLLWYVTSTKRSHPITVDEARILWKIHKKTEKCRGHKWRPITRRGGKLKGFQCECGYKYKQNRPLVAGAPARNN